MLSLLRPVRAHLSQGSLQRLRTFTSNTFLASDLTIEETKNPKEKLSPEKLVFGKNFTDHMLEVDWSEETGWGAPRIVPHHKLEIDPAAPCLHYAIECFEGMKAYLDKAGKLRLFRPDKNMERLNNTANRLCLPTFDGHQLVECLKELLILDKNFCPFKPGYSLYIRPTMIATDCTLGVHASASAKLFVILSPCGPYYKTGFAPVKLFSSSQFVRAWPGGTGGSKAGCNYAPTIFPQKEAAHLGYQQVMWLFGDQHYLSEVGTMNVFVFFEHENGERELVTPPLDGTILPGVTRDSILQLCRDWNEFKVSERMVPMAELVEAVEKGQVLEMFGAGTAAIVSPIKGIRYEDQKKDLVIPLDRDNPDAMSGPLAARLARVLMDIQYGNVEHHWSVVVD